MKLRVFTAAFMAVLLLNVGSCSAPGGGQRIENVGYARVVALPVRDPDARFSYGDDALQFAELWRPKADLAGAVAGEAPLVVFIHGGCWLNAYDISHSRAMSAALADSGYTVWSLEYRRTGDKGGGWPGTFEDILLALRYLGRENPARLDLSRVSIVGHSAGGHLALLAGAHAASLGFKPERVVGLAAITQLLRYAEGDNSCQKAVASFMGGGPDERRLSYIAADPSENSLYERSVLLQGDKDQIVPQPQARHSGIDYEIIPGAGHFDFLYPGSVAWQVLLNTLSAE